MNGFLTNKATNFTGIVTLGFVLWNIWQTKTVNVDDLKNALIGAGFLAAKDFNVTGGTTSF